MLDTVRVTFNVFSFLQKPDSITNTEFPSHDSITLVISSVLVPLLRSSGLPALPVATVTSSERFCLKNIFYPQFTSKWRSNLFLKMLSDEVVTIASGKRFELSHTLLDNAINRLYVVDFHLNLCTKLAVLHALSCRSVRLCST